MSDSTLQEEIMIEIDETAGELVVETFVTNDSDVTSYFADIPEGERRATLETALRIGILSLRSGETVDDIDYVEKRFTDLRQHLEDRIDELLGKEGEVRKYVDNHFGDEGRLVGEVFDPENEETPLGKLRRSIDQEIQQLRTDLEVAEKEAELVEATHLSGDEFEEDVYNLLTDLAATTGDRVVRTGTESGLLGKSKKGDIVVDLQDISATVVVEAKDKYESQPSIDSEMEEALENRGADFGLYVARSTDNVPNDVGWFNEYDRKYLVVVLSDGENEEFASELLRVGYRWAKSRAMEQRGRYDDRVDIGAIHEEIEGVERSLKKVTEIKKKCSAIEDTADDIRAEADDLREVIQSRLDSVSDHLESSGSPEPE